MSLRYTKIVNQPRLFLRLFGLQVDQFDLIMIRLAKLWHKRVIDKYQRPGRDFKLSLEDMTLMLLLYYRSYTTQVFVGYIFGIDESRVCRLIKRLEPILAQVTSIIKTKHLSKEEVESIIIDATEQPIERPEKDQQKYYSGKKKRHTLKTEIQITPSGRITNISKTRPGFVHDFNLHKQGPPLPPDTRIYVDSGYQGLDKLHQQTELPYKASKYHPLDHEEKQYNQALTRVRVVIENVLAKLKIFKILSQTYRNKRKRYNVKFNIIAGITNIKSGFVS